MKLKTVLHLVDSFEEADMTSEVGSSFKPGNDKIKEIYSLQISKFISANGGG